MNDGDQPVTKNDPKRELQEFEARFLEALEATDTKLLAAFYGFVESNQKHLVELDRGDYTLRERLMVLENRVAELEKRLNMPPPRRFPRRTAAGYNRTSDRCHPLPRPSARASLPWFRRSEKQRASN